MSVAVRCIVATHTNQNSNLCSKEIAPMLLDTCVDMVGVAIVQITTRDELVTLLDLSVPPIMRMTGARRAGPRSGAGGDAIDGGRPAMAKGSAVCVCVCVYLCLGMSWLSKRCSVLLNSVQSCLHVFSG